jgi:hypothetical protein
MYAYHLFLDHRKNKERVARDIDEDLPFLKMTTENGKILQEIHREHAERKKRFVDGNRQLEMKIYCEKRVPQLLFIIIQLV